MISHAAPGFWWSLDANEVSGTWSATRLDATVLEKLIEPKLTGEEPLASWKAHFGHVSSYSKVSKCTGGCRLTAQGLKNKGKPMCAWVLESHDVSPSAAEAPTSTSWPARSPRKRRKRWSAT